MQNVTVFNVQDIKNSGGLVTGKLVFEMFIIKKVNCIYIILSGFKVMINDYRCLFYTKYTN